MRVCSSVFCWFLVFFFFSKTGVFPKSFVKPPDEGSGVLGVSGGEESTARSSRSGWNKETTSAKTLHQLEETIAELRKALETEQATTAALRKANSELELHLAAKKDDAADVGAVSSTLVEDFKLQLEKRKVEIAELTAKKKKYKKHARAMDQRVKELKAIKGGRFFYVLFQFLTAAVIPPQKMAAAAMQVKWKIYKHSMLLWKRNSKRYQKSTQIWNLNWESWRKKTAS